MILVRIIMFPFALIYGLVVRIRNYFYDIGIFNSKKFGTPTICIGNLSLGGTGKTPMVEFLISELRETHKIAILSRGYKRGSTGFVLANENSTVEEMGDEPWQIHQKFKEVLVAVDADRCHGIEKLEKELKPNLIILDDAFQHRKVRPSFSILLTAHNKLFCNDFFFPTGTLRDSRNQAKRADIIVVTKCPLDLSKDDQSRIVEKLRPEPHQKVLFSYLEYAPHLMGPASETETTVDELMNKRVTLVTGIADPEPLTHYLKQKGLDFEHLRFSDHHSFTKNEIANLNTKEQILTTEKDFVRLQGKVKNLRYIEVAHRFFDKGKEELIGAMETVTKRSS